MVYKNKKNLFPGQELNCSRIDEQTGEVYFDDSADLLTEDNKAIHKRLGNAATINGIVEEISNAIRNPNALLLRKVLYSATHAGDVIPLNDLLLLQKEIEQVEHLTQGNRSDELQQFLSSLGELIDEAKRQSNPIVFV